MSTTESAEFEKLLHYLKHSRGFDFTGYKRSTLMRRMQKRMGEVRITDFAEYHRHLEVHPDEFAALFNTILINVTAFRRDPEAWDSLQEIVIPRLLEIDDGRPIRVWSAGCASGEETYTLMMMLADALGIDRFKRQVKMYATDADTEALTQARLATYRAAQIEPLPEAWRTTYFEPGAGGFVFRQDLRRSVIFGEHDLVQDAPISHLDLLVCRNTLIYFNAETQTRIVARFNFALKDRGHLFLGRSEMLLTHTHMFTPVDVKARIFTKVARPDVQPRLNANASEREAGQGGDDTLQLVYDTMFQQSPTAYVLLDAQNAILMVNEQARALFRLTNRDAGRPLQDVELSYRPIEIRSRIEEAVTGRSMVTVPDTEHRLAHGEARYYDIQITPLFDDKRRHLGTSISFVDATDHHRLKSEYERARHEIEAANEQLQSTNEELETTNEELQSTIEELETTNEELQSTNEELETINEELQSTNEELEDTNEELRRRTNELNDVNDFLDAIMASMEASVVVIDPALHVMLWNRKAEDMWGLRAEEAEGKSFERIDIGLPVKELAQLMQQSLNGRYTGDDIVVRAINRRGREIQCRVTCTPLVSPQHGIRGLILFMEEWAPR
jgi:two-component system, chemotaxis family, CheB/CheR fusion protein